MADKHNQDELLLETGTDDEIEYYEFPASFAQNRMWLINQMNEDSGMYNMPMAVRFEGPLHIEALENSLQEIVDRHETLRTTFAMEDGELLQVIASEAQITIPQLDLQHLSPEEQEAKVRELSSREAETPFDLEQGPLLRSTLLKLGAEEHVLLFAKHHIISDGMSMAVMIHELVVLYEAFLDGKPSPLPPLEIQYADYASWQREWFTGSVYEQHLDYWRGKLGGEIAPLQLPTDRARPANPSPHGGHVLVELPNALMDKLNNLTKQFKGSTLFMTMLAAYKAFLYRYTGQDDLAVGTPIAGRKQPGIEHMIGFFVNTLVLRSDLSDDPTFRELLDRVRQTTLDAYTYQEMPFEKLVEELKPDRSASNPFFQTMFVVQNVSTPDLTLRDLKISAVEVQRNTAKFDLMFTVDQRAGRPILVAEFSTDLFDAGTVERMLNHFLNLLQAVVDNPDLQISKIPLLSEQEVDELIDGCNQTARNFPTDKLVHELFERWAAANPDAVAIQYEEESVTYRELNERANQLARLLKAEGVGPEKVVGIYLERSPNMIVALLSILKAGGAFVSFDPAFPQDRIGFMMEDSEAPVILTQQSLAGLLPQHDAKTFCLDAQWSEVAANSTENLPNEATLENLVYLIFTSGSTGRSKGVQVEHRNLLNYLYAIEEVAQLGDGASYGNVSTLAADVGHTAIFPALCRGGTLHIIAQERLTDPDLMAEYFDKHPVDCLKIVPTHLAALMASQPLKVLPKKGAVVGGETLRWDLIERVEEYRDDVWLINHYGPTEVTIAGVVYKVEKDPEMRKTVTVPLGRPLGNVQVYVLDKHLQPVPYGVAGEVYFGGAGVTRGYIKRPDLTAERYLKDPFKSDPDARFYRTGDLAKRHPDGRLEFLTRADTQVKIRGYRVELGEVETVIGQHELVKENVVVAREDVPGDRRLVAYIVKHEGVEGGTAEVRTYLKGILPDYMIPAAFVFLDAIPLTANGKIDRRILPDPEGLIEQSEYIAPSTELEAQIAAIWAEVLNTEQVSVADNFFDLGGHSLMVTQVVSRLNKALGIKLPLRTLFEAPTIVELALRVEALNGEAAAPARSEAPIEPISRDGKLPLSFSQQRLWVLEKLIPGLTAYNIPYAVRLTGELHHAHFETALNEMIERHESFRTTFSDASGEPEQVIHAAVWTPLPVVDLTHLHGAALEAEVARLVQAENETPFDLRQGPLIRYQLLKLGAAEHVLLLTLHHIISDGWSRGILIQELTHLYDVRVSGKASALQPLPLQYADFAAWQRKFLQEELGPQIDYWKNQLGGDLPALQLPTDRPRPPMQSHKGAQLTFRLPQEVGDKLIRLSQQQGATLFMTLMAAFQTLMMHYSGQEDFAVGTPIANRNRQDTESIIGFFVNTLAMRADLSGNPTFLELISRAKESALGAFAHQDVPFEKIVEEVETERDLSRTPVFQVLFGLQNFRQSKIELAGLTFEPVEDAGSTAKFDLSLLMSEGEEYGVGGTFEYNTDLFDASTIERMLGHFVQLLTALADDPALRVGSLSLLTDAERERVVTEWNRTATAYPTLSIQALFEAQAAATPDAAAVVYGNAKLTYRQLNERANQIAHHLKGLGVGPDVLVGLCSERSLEMIISLLGILKAGGAYVPLDPNYPQERIAYMLEDTKVPVLITTSALEANLPEHGANVICLDRDWLSFAGQSTDNPACETTQDHLAYVIYTSGSTGRPKGVVVPQRGVVRLVKNTNYMPFSAEHVFLQAATFSFDVATFDIWGPLLNGAKLVLMPAGQPSLEEIGQTIREQGITVLWLTAGLFHQMVEYRLDDLQSVRYLLAGGDVLSVPHVKKVLRELPDVTMINGYGPTENTTFTSCHTMTGEGDVGSTVSIGRPISNTTVYVMNKELQPVPVGVPGELMTGGDGLALGYLNRPDLTAEKFIDTEFGRLYRTGDLVRWLADGSLEFMGRIDQQVKIRGFRIEIGEIETVLGSQPGVRQCVVIAHDADGDKRLAGYVVPEPGSELQEEALRAMLRKQLPDYMMPSFLILLDELPLSPNGKVDRKKLPAPEAAVGGGSTYVAPRTPEEEKVAAIFTEVLRVEQVGIHDNFFALGGHSLMATQIISRIAEEYGVTVPLRLLFELPTVAQFTAGLLEARSNAPAQAPDAQEIKRVARRPDAQEITAVPRRRGAARQADAPQAEEPLHTNKPHVELLQEAVRLEAMERAQQALFAAHDLLRTTFLQTGSEPEKLVHEPKWAPLRVIYLRGLEADAADAKVQEILRQEAQTPLDPQTETVRFYLIQKADADFTVVLNLHPLLAKEAAPAALVQELLASYATFKADVTV
ncbi:amino acid adenylation domain-containing protein [Tumebacillus sp. BK434]|uniref:non-ribosomal peptide synthetase n=1 Tax=Tumebacillus sp. BK434 TaxID=2512169 RepID=UPI00104821C5|nr:non-ribosomal peptide synthetase [Tumebacillus sp. BK434]TCP58025.1 amino acid adenylation domain-containing protein [Tumebacillus sp. BK434]